MIRICRNGHLTGFARCPMCGDSIQTGRGRTVRRGAMPTVAATRQVMRARALQDAMNAVNGANLSKVRRQGQVVGWSGMKRADRRKLARAYAKGVWKVA